MKTKAFKVGSTIVFVLIGAVLLTAACYYMYRQSRTMTSRTIIKQMEELSNAFKQINESCEIIGIAAGRPQVDFLTVTSFIGSEVGPLVLKYPAKWKGPYIKQNYKVQGKLYEIVKIADGYVIVPGEGVQLSDNKIMGKEIRLTPTTKLSELMKNSSLTYDGNPLVIPLKTSFEKPGITLLEGVSLSN